MTGGLTTGSPDADAGHAYPDQPGNPAPYGGNDADWRRWIEGLVVLSHFGVRCLSAGSEEVTFSVEQAPLGPNPNGAVHGGVLAAILDEVSGVAFTLNAEANRLPATATITVDYLRPAFAPLIFTARVAASGRTLVHCDTMVVDSTGKTCCRCRAIMASKQITR